MIKYNLTMWDAGHTLTGGDTGAVGNGIKEQELTREIVNWCDKYCQYLGMPTKYAHCNDAKTELSSLQYRVNKQRITGADVFVSLHGNANVKKDANGTETFIYATGGDAEKIAKRITSKMVALGFTDRTFGKGYKIANHMVTRETTCPAVLVETFFLTCAKDVDLFNKIGGAKRVAHAICEGLYDTTIPYDAVGGSDNTQNSTPAPTPNKEKWANVVNVSSSLNVRDKATTDSRVIGSVFPNEKVLIKWTEPGWHYIRYSTAKGYKEGYVSAKYIKEI